MEKRVSSGFPFADRVAEVVFARPDTEQPKGVRYEDRADPGTESALEELEAAELDWYGEKFALRWLAPGPAARVRLELFS